LAAVGETGDLGPAVSRVATTCSGLIELEPHLIDERKKKYVEHRRSL
jgi:hypothetical protein